MTKHPISPYILSDLDSADEKFHLNEKENWQFIGAALSIHGKQIAGPSQAIVDYVNDLLTAKRHGLAHLLVNRNGKPLGLVLCANLAEDVSSRIIRTRRCELSHSEWNEGNQLWVARIVCAPVLLPHIICHLSNCFSQVEEVIYCRQRKDGLVFRAVKTSHALRRAEATRKKQMATAEFAAARQ